MIIVITTKETLKNGREQIVASHGVDLATGNNVILPCETPQVLGARFDATYREYMLEG